MQRLVPSRYNVLIGLRHGRTLAYNSLSVALAVWSSTDTEAFTGLAGTVMLGDTRASDFVKGGFLVSESTDELAELERQYVEHRFDGSALILTIAPTLACNFGCDYCFQGAGKPNDTMSAAVQDRILVLVQRVAPDIKRVHVAWYGGEPLMRRKVIEDLSDRLLAFCQSRGLRYDASMVSNGYLLNAEVLKSLEARGVKTIQVTLDGVPAYHDRRRYLLNGKPTFQRILDNLQACAAASPIHLSIRVNIDARNAPDIHTLIDHLSSLGLGNRNNFKLYFAPIEAITEGCHSVADDCMPKSEYGLLESQLYRHGFEQGITPLPYPPRFRGTCAAVKPKGFVILPGGDVHKCWDTVSNPAFRIGTVFDLDAFDANPLSQRWLDWTPFVNETCRNCRILPNCAGACAYKFVHSADTRGEAAVLPCPSWKYNIKEQLLLRAEKMGAITPEDYDPDVTRTDPREICTEVKVSGGQALPLSMLNLVQLTPAAQFTSPSR